ncbi:MAG TPA: choice-of-anchor tandem repeat GloVer-containing protein, partial [Candidatus Binatia bacterium]|nr:choice-of-anchor tandem repeat GloVer-containing protein [Candidatus Binatia bacterium]
MSTPGLAQITTLTSFDKTDGRDPGYPAAPFVQGTNGGFYGTTAAGGVNDEGTVFEMTSAGTLNTLYSFCSQPGCSDGAVANAGLIQATDGNLYGTTDAGGDNNFGTIFRITPAGSLTTLYRFCSAPGCSDGANPSAGLMQASDGAFYGTTAVGGAYGAGTVFKITTAGTLATLASFAGANGNDPAFGSLIQGVNGNFYGTTISGGANTACGIVSGCGTVFSMTPGGQLTTIYSFCAQPNCADGTELFGGLVLGADGELYGITALGGANNYGTVFKLTKQGALKTLHSFDFSDGAYPEAALIQGTDGKFYGTTSNGGAHGDAGTVFEITSHGELTTLYDFCAEAGCTDGTGPFEGLMQATNGEFYGTTFSGGTSSNCIGGCGTAFSLETGLAPFVSTRPSSGRAGSRVIILGNNLSGATAVSFNGT